MQFEICDRHSLMAEHIGHRLERGAATDHVSGYRVAKHVSTGMSCRYPSLPQRLRGYRPDGYRTPKGTVRVTQVEEHLPPAGGGAAVLQVGGQCLTNIFR